MEKDLLNVNKKHYEILLNDLDPKVLEKLHDDFLVSYTYDAVSLEGNNKKPFSDVRRIIKIGTVMNPNDKDEKEIINHVAAFNKVLELLKRNRDLTEEQVKDIHDILLKDIIIGGVYRNVNIKIIGGAHQPPDYIKVYDRMGTLFDSIKTLDLDDFDKGIYLMASIAKIYPFLDANGRLTRLVLNYYLMKAGYVPISIPIAKKDIYFKALESFKVDKDIEPLTNLIISLLNSRYEIINQDLEF